MRRNEGEREPSNIRDCLRRWRLDALNDLEFRFSRCTGLHGIGCYWLESFMVCFAADNCRQRLGNDESLIKLDVLEQHLNPIFVPADMFLLESHLHSDRCNSRYIAIRALQRYFKPK
jgi:hypothetical protein